VIVRFVDIGEIIFHHCLTFLIIAWFEHKKNQRIYYDNSKPWNLGHHSLSENDTSKCMVDIFSLILNLWTVMKAGGLAL
jgi:hypothetical protein